MAARAATPFTEEDFRQLHQRYTYGGRGLTSTARRLHRGLSDVIVGRYCKTWFTGLRAKGKPLYTVVLAPAPEVSPSAKRTRKSRYVAGPRRL